MDSAGNIEFSKDGFGELPRSLPENCVEYLLFVVDNKNEARSPLPYLEDVRKAAIQLCDKMTKGYIWQRDSFQLRLERNQDLVYLHGTTDYGDSVEDEWLIVYLLRELTKSFPTLWVRIFDGDGEFLFVEAASVLPKWLSPEIDSNRAWIHDGKFYMIPLAASSDTKRPLSLPEAVGLIKTSPNILIHSTFVEAEAFYRLEKYPKHITDTIHHSIVTIPRKLAYILHEKPSTMAPAVESFYLRHPVAIKSISSPSGNVHFPPEDLVAVSVKFTKVLFAQLKSQRFPAPPIWSATLEAAENRAAGEDDARKRLARLEMGMKVTSGFEMLAADAANKDSRLAREFSVVLEDVEEDGVQALPTNEDIRKWEDAYRDDDESWLDINFEQFENELEGSKGPQERPRNGFGDSSAQANLQKIVSRFEAFLNDEKAGVDGAEGGGMDDDDDISDDSEEYSDDEDKAVSFDEEQFSSLMREMMGLPAAQYEDSKNGAKYPNNANARNTIDNEDEDIRQIAAQMEAELKEHGALKLDPEPERRNAIESGDDTDLKSKTKDDLLREVDGGEESSGEEVDVDYNLAKNLLESFKSQAGMAGPAGNILGMMGLQLPRDEDEEDDN
ncbi:SGT1-domain-containing protein [Annulohypoxylon maeteangense]|uniref:SGT1-domain-containing protein n=1 Tax=Annulohypoxylon maeteangense TaxID=1927788 RepID=UPI00200801D2|nr:SGT1-domain-containing protein [Annulohypoxylon maeteangense]KAI0880996.1 SGT1-domain-containing protein [Annulohypoxylon maeteangense]